MFFQKLDFVMNLTNTQASMLAKVCNLNASYVSRLRNGSRSLPKNPEYLSEMCGYLAKRIRADYQKNVMCDALRLHAWPADDETATGLLRKWFVGEPEKRPDLSPLLASFAAPQPTRFAAAETATDLPRPKNYYYGPGGKQEAVLQFFHMVLNEKTPQTLLLVSEEEMSWLYEDRDFSARWAQSFTDVLMAGNRVKIVHTVGRNINELLEAVVKWIPIYMTGMIEPYYYPRLRDGVFQRTLFLAPKTAAVVAASVENRTAGMLNELVTDHDAVAALTLEYEHYFSLCRPLMHILTLSMRNELWKACDALIGAEGQMVCMSDMPTLATMPRWVAAAMQERAPMSCILKQWRAVSRLTKKLSEDACYTEILPFPADGKNLRSRSKKGHGSPEAAACGETEIPLPCADLLGAPGLCYTAEEWHAHLENSLHFAGKHSGYRQLLHADIPPHVCLFAKEGRGVIMIKNNSPGVAFAFTEANMQNAFWDYLTRDL